MNPVRLMSKLALHTSSHEPTTPSTNNDRITPYDVSGALSMSKVPQIGYLLARAIHAHDFTNLQSIYWHAHQRYLLIAMRNNWRIQKDSSHQKNTARVVIDEILFPKKHECRKCSGTGLDRSKKNCQSCHGSGTAKTSGYELLRKINALESDEGKHITKDSWDKTIYDRFNQLYTEFSELSDSVLSGLKRQFE